MELSNLTKTSTKSRKRVGRGNGSGNGKTCGRGHKGQNSRSGGGVPAWFEGGQMPLYRRLPIRGFNNARFKKHYQLVNLSKLSIFEENSEISPKELADKGIISTLEIPVKILGKGEIKVSLKVKAAKFSKTAIEKIQAKGGEVIVL